MWRRLGARLIDAGVLMVVVLVVVGAVMGILLAVYADRMDEPNPPLGVALGVLGCYALVILLGIAYEVGFIARRGATPGKSWLGIQVVRLDTMQVPDMGAALMRWFLPFIAGIVLPLSIVVYVSPWFDGTKWLRGWHDKAARVLVTRSH